MQVCFNANPEPNIPLLNNCLQNVLKYLNRNWLHWQIPDHHFSGEAIYYISQLLKFYLTCTVSLQLFKLTQSFKEQWVIPPSVLLK